MTPMESEEAEMPHEPIPPYPKNATGDFSIEKDCCITCEAPYHEAPELMAHDEAGDYALGIPGDETYEAHFCVPAEGVEVFRPVNREGCTGCFLQELSHPSEGAEGAVPP